MILYLNGYIYKWIYTYIFSSLCVCIYIHMCIWFSVRVWLCRIGMIGIYKCIIRRISTIICVYISCEWQKQSKNSYKTQKQNTHTLANSYISTNINKPNTKRKTADFNMFFCALFLL